MINFALVGMLVVLVTSCGGNDESISVPVPTEPQTGGGGDFVPPPIPDADGRIPDLTNAAPILLSDGLNGLTEMFNFIAPPLVGDPLVKMEISNGRSSTVTGTVLIVFEDSIGFGGAMIGSFQNVGVRNSSYIDMIFADDELVVRTVSFFSGSGDDLDGTIYYRVRQSGENQCKKLIVNCNGNPFCNPNPDVETPCREYMNLSHAGVKSLGSFEAKYSDWVK